MKTGLHHPPFLKDIVPLHTMEVMFIFAGVRRLHIMWNGMKFPFDSPFDAPIVSPIFDPYTLNPTCPP